MKKGVLFLFVFILFAGNNGLTQVFRFSSALIATEETQIPSPVSKSLPIPDAEEHSQKDKDGSEELSEDVDIGLSDGHTLTFHASSGDLRLDFLDFSLNSAERQILVPPPWS